MTRRLYYHDSYLNTFEAVPVDRDQINGAPALALDASAFYPTGGGQPCDTGILNHIPVLEVMSDDETGVVWHVLESSLDTEAITGQINWQRRFDHMQQHTGQHILTRSFIETLQAETIGFHLGDASVTIDLNRGNVSDEEIEQAESLANQIIYENRPVRAWFPTDKELEKLSPRKISDKVQGAVRVVDIGSFDITACGGTHVASTGEVGMIKVLRQDKQGDGTRITFCCGYRALGDYREKNILLNQMAAQMTTSYQQIPETLEKMRTENRELNRQLKQVRQQLVQYESVMLWQQATQREPYVLVTAVFDQRPEEELQYLASHLVNYERTLALLGKAGEKAHLIFARSSDLELDVVPLLKKALHMLGTSRGGGKSALARGGGVQATVSQIEEAIASVIQSRE